MTKFVIISLALLLAISHAAPAEKPAESRQDDLAAEPVEKEDLKTAASHWGGHWGGWGGHYGGYGGYGGYGWGYPHYGGYGSYGYGWPSYGYGYGYGWPYGGYGYGGHGYWW